MAKAGKAGAWVRLGGWVALGLLWALLSSLRPGQAFVPPPAPTLTPDLAAFPLVTTYDLGQTTLAQQGVAAEFETMPLPLTGAIAHPPGAAPVPWVVVLHGRHGGCHFQPEATSQWPCPPGTETRFDLGFAYLAQALAEAGYGVLIPNLNGAFSETYGATADNRNELADQRSGQILDAHLSRLALAHRGEEVGFGRSLTGRVDLGRLALVGHSMGGGAAALSALRRGAAPAASATGLGPMAALVLVSPTRSYALGQRPDASQLPDLPTVVLAGGCDRDIFDLSSLYYLETARHQPRQTPALGLLLPGANHNYFNAAVAEDDYYRQPDNAPLCNPQRSRQRLSRVAQEDFLRQYVPAFLGTVWSDPAEAALAEVALAPNRAAPARLFGQPVRTTLVMPTAQRRTVFAAQPLDSHNTPHNGPQPVLSDGLTASFCPALSDCEPARPYPQFPALLTVGWQTPTEWLRIPLSDDISRFASLELRLVPDPAWAVPPQQPAFAVVLRDGQGRAARVEIPATVPALGQFEADPVAGATAPLYASALRIPLGQFGGIDLAAVTQVELVFDQAPQGRLHLASIEFV